MIVDCAAYVNGIREGGTLTIAEGGAAHARAGTVVWLGLRVPSLEELSEALDAFGVTATTASAILAPHARPVIETTDELTVLVMRTAHYNATIEQVMLGELSILFGRGFVITVRHGQASPLTDLRHRLESEPSYLALGPAAIVTGVIEQIISDYRPVLDGFESAAVDVESDVFRGDVGSKPARRIYNLRRELRELLVAVEALDEPIARLVRRHRDQLDVEVEADLEEAIDQLRRSIRRARSLSDLLASALDANLAQISVQQNEDMRKISAWVAIAAVPTMIAGIYGMNFEEMPELRSAWGYPLVLSFMALACGFLYRKFRRAGWL